jgi:nitrogen regulatory protein PII 2
MKELMAVIRMNMINKTKQALIDTGISSITVKDVLGRGKGMVDFSLLKGAELGYEEAIVQLGQSQRLVPKRLLIIILPDESVAQAVDTIISVNQSKKSGDGKIFIQPIIDAVRVRTNEHGMKAIDESF